MGPVPPPVPPLALSGGANQGAEMEVMMGRYVAVQKPVSTGHTVGEDGRGGGMQDAVAIPLRGSVEGPIPGRGEGALGRAQADADGIRHAPKLAEMPAELVGDGGLQRASKSIMKGLPTGGLSARVAVV